MDPGVIAGRFKERQGHQRNGWGDGQGTDVAHEKANETGETHQHLDTGGHHDSALQLKESVGLSGDQATPQGWLQQPMGRPDYTCSAFSGSAEAKRDPKERKGRELTFSCNCLFRDIAFTIPCGFESQWGGRLLTRTAGHSASCFSVFLSFTLCGKCSAPFPTNFQLQYFRLCGPRAVWQCFQASRVPSELHFQAVTMEFRIISMCQGILSFFLCF